MKRIASYRLAWIAVIAASALLSTTTSALAFSGGIYDAAKAGCTCHGGVVPPNTTTQLLIDGLPEDGYVPGTTYDLTVWVLGVAVPTGPTTLSSIAGFNLMASAGPLTNVDTLASVRVRSECEVVQSAGGTGVKGPDSCTSTASCFAKKCSTPGQGDCRACRNDLVDIQAAHTREGASTFTWALRWTAPTSGDVSFWLAGNAVNGGGSNDLGDNWSRLDPPIVVSPAS